MMRRNSVRLHDIVLADPKSSSYYNKLRNEGGKQLLPVMSENDSQTQTLTIELPDGNPLTISCDPLLIAEFLHMKESGDADEETDDTFDREGLLPSEAVPKVVIPQAAAKRKRSAIDEHKKVEAALRASGVLLD
jgi:hypothetical protein